MNRSPAAAKSTARASARRPVEVVKPDAARTRQPPGRFAPPSAPPGMVARVGLGDALAAWPARRLTLMTGPAGYGKTTALGQVWRSLDAAVCKPWLTLAAADRAPERLRADLSGALAFAGAPAPVWTGTPEEDGARLAEGLCGLGRPVWFVLDNYQAAQTPEFDALVAAALASGGGPLHIVVAARERPQIGAAAWATLGELIDLKGAALRFSLEESRVLLGGRLAACGLEVLHARTDGWPAALRLAVRALDAGGGNAAPEIQGGAGEMGDYLAEEVFAPLPSALRDFLVQTARLDVINAPTANAARGKGDSAALLAWLARSNAPVFPVGADPAVVRVHPLLREFLDTQWTQLPCAARRATEERTVQFLAAAGRMEDAWRCALQTAAPHSLVAQLEAAPLAALWRTDRLVGIEPALVAAGAVDAAVTPRLMALRALGHWEIAGTAQARASAEEARAALDARVAAAPPQQVSAAAQAASLWRALQAVVFDEGCAETDIAAAAVLSGVGDPDRPGDTIAHVAAVSALRSGRSGDARRIAALWAANAAPGGGARAFFALTQSAFFCLEDGAVDCAAAALNAARVQDICDARHAGLRTAWGICRAMVAEQGGRAVEPGAWAPDAAILLGLSPEMAVEAARLQAQAIALTDGFGAAHAVLVRARAAVEARGWRHAAAALVAEDLMLALRAGERGAARRTAKALVQLGASDSPRASLALACWDLDSRSPEARRRLQTLLASSRLAGRWRVSAHAMAARAARDVVERNNHLARALALSGEGAMCVPFFAAPADCIGAILAMGADVAALDFDDPRLNAIVDLVVARPYFSGGPALEPATARERAVLAALRRSGEGAAPQRRAGVRAKAAEALGMSENTLKADLKRVNQKWGVGDWRLAALVAERLSRQAGERGGAEIASRKP